jgi:hypothetical protein
MLVSPKQLQLSCNGGVISIPCSSLSELQAVAEKNQYPSSFGVSRNLLIIEGPCGITVISYESHCTDNSLSQSNLTLFDTLSVISDQSGL